MITTMDVSFLLPSDCMTEVKTSQISETTAISNDQCCLEFVRGDESMQEACVVVEDTTTANEPVFEQITRMCSTRSVTRTSFILPDQMIEVDSAE